MTTRHLIATKPHTYGTRHLEAGEGYEASAKHAKLLVAIKKSRYDENRGGDALAAPPQDLVEKIKTRATQGRSTPPGEIAKSEPPAAPPPEPMNQGASTDPAEGAAADLAAVRAEYSEKMGKRPFNGWDINELRAKMAGAQS